VTWVYISEIFPSTVRGRAASVAIVALWIVCFLVTTTFLSLLHSVGPSGTFAFYAAMSVGTFVFVYHELPETRNKSLEEIGMQWGLHREK
jgi:MFS family permease